MDASKLYRASQGGSKVANELGTIEIERQVISNLNCLSGKIVACDPLTLYGARAFEQEIQPGDYSIELYIALISYHAGMGGGSDRRVATAILRVTQSPPTRWKLATLPGESETDLKEGQIFGYGVDSGTGGFMDNQAVEVLRRKLAEDEAYEYREQILHTLRSTDPGLPVGP